ncbi:MAG: tetratricopeptide repeat protein [Candidatus Obscuribacterales bacterium]|nr:tetratricopeptide repeat protein [Candidatus Obscuribacterales bacterium]
MKNSRLILKQQPQVLSLLLSATIALGSSGLLAQVAWAANKFEMYSTSAEKAYGAQDYPEAEKNFLEALNESGKLEKGDKRPATTMYNLALVYQAQGKYKEAEDMFVKAKDAFVGFYGADHQRVGQVYLDMADLYVQQAGEDAKPELRTKAAENYKNAIAVFEKIYAQATGQAPAEEKKPEATELKPKTTAEGDDKKKEAKQADSGKSPAQEAASNLASAIRSLAGFYAENDEFTPAEPLYTRMLELDDFAYGGEDKQIVKDKAQVAEFYCVQGKYKPATPLFEQAVALSEKVNGPESLETAQILYNFGGLQYDEGTFNEAERMFKLAIKIFEKNNHDENDVAMKSIALADVLDMQSKSEEAQTVYKKSIASLEKNDDPAGLIACLKGYQKHLLILNRKDEATKVGARIKELKAGANKKAAQE